MTVPWECVATLHTEQPVNCLLPDPSRPHTVWYGTYAHHSDCHREGGLGSWNWKDAAVVDSSASPTFAPLPGVFDMIHFNGWESTAMCDNGLDTLVSCTDGSVRGVRRCLLEGDAPDACPINQWTAAVDEEMITSCCRLSDGLGCSAHLGNLSQMVRGPDGELVPYRKWHGHEFDAWCVCSSGEIGEGETILWSGGDDGTLAMWDVRAPVGDPPSASVRRRFDAGVVTIVVGGSPAFGLASSFEMLVGSYDESLYVLDSRSLKRPLASVSVGGGAWRCRAAPPSPTTLCRQFVVAAMQGGARLVQWDPTIAALTLQETDGVLHGTDEQPPSNGSEGVLIYDATFVGDENTIATASFYNQTVKIWQRSSIA